MTLRKLVIANERWFISTVLTVTYFGNNEKHDMTVDEILADKELSDSEVISFNSSTVFIKKEE